MIVDCYKQVRVLKKHSMFLLAMITDTARVFCGQAPLDTQDSSSYTSAVKKRCLINLNYRNEGGTDD
jgi:hypothetical protein